MNQIQQETQEKTSPFFKISDNGFAQFQKDFLLKQNKPSKTYHSEEENSLFSNNSKMNVNYDISLTIPPKISKDLRIEIPKTAKINEEKIDNIIELEENNGKIPLQTITDSSPSPVSPNSGLKRRLKKVKLEIDQANTSKEKPTLAGQNNNEKLLENHLNMKNSTVIPFVKKFIHILRNSTAMRDISQLKENSFQILHDKTYFHKEEFLKRELNNAKGSALFILKLRNACKAIKLQLKKIRFILLLKMIFKLWVPILHPYQNVKIMWDVFHLLLITFWFFYLPLLISFFDANYYSMIYLKISLTFFSIDIFMKLSTAYFKSGVLEDKRSKIFMNYIKKHFLIDIIALFPLFLDYFVKTNLNSSLFDCLEHIATNVQCLEIDEKNELFSLLRKYSFVKFLIFVKIKDFKMIISRILEKFQIQEKYQNVMSLFKLAFISLLFAHVVGCLWHLIADINYSERNWITTTNLQDSSWEKQYLYSIYWSSTTIMTVGYGDISPQNSLEVMFALITIIFGCGIYAFNLNSIGIILQEINKENTIFKHNINVINQFMNRKSVTPDLQMRVREYLRYIWKEEKAQNLEEETNIINVLSTNLKEELLLEAYGEILRKYPLFYANFSEKALKKVVHCIKDCKFIPEEVIFDEGGTEDPSIYFIMKGEVEIYANKPSIIKENSAFSSNNEAIVLNTLKPGDFFGEISFFTGNPRMTSAKSMDFTTLFTIKRSDFVNILRNNENFIDDYDKLCMIKDQLLFYENYNPLRSRCFACNQLGHLANKCNLIHYLPDYEKIIKRHNFQIDQDRNNSFKRRPKTGFSALKSRKSTDSIVMKLRANLKKAEEELEINKYKHFKQFMRNLTGRIILEEDDSSLDEEEDEEEEEENPNEVLDTLSGLEQNADGVYEHTNENTGDLNEINENQGENKKNHELSNSVNNETSKNNHYLSKDTDKTLMKSIKFEPFMQRSDNSLALIPSQNTRNSLTLPNKPIIKGYRHSAMAIYGNSNQEEEEKSMTNQKSDMEISETNSKRVNKNAIISSQKPILKNNAGNFEFVQSSIHSLPKMKASVFTKMTKNKPESSSFLPESNIQKKNEEKDRSFSKQTHNSSSSNISVTNLEQLIKTVECFENFKNFKNYFPDNNLNRIINSMNSLENTRKSFQDKKEKQRRIVARLSKYTFFSEEMKEKMPDVIMRRIRNSKNSKTFNWNNNINNEINSPTLFLLQQAHISEKKQSEGSSPNDKKRKTGFFKEKEGVERLKFVELAEFLVRNKELRKNLKAKKRKFLK